MRLSEHGQMNLGSEDEDSSRMGPQPEPESGENLQPFIRDAVSQLPGRMCHLRACVPPLQVKTSNYPEPSHPAAG